MDASLDYLQLAEKTRTTVLGYAAQDWPVTKNSNGIQLSAHKVPHTSAKIYKAVCQLNAPPSSVFDLIVVNPGDTTTDKRRIQKSIKSWEVLQECDDNVFILRSVSFSAGGGLISSREYFDLVGNYKDHDGGIYLSCATGVEYSYPKDSKIVRGWNYPSGIMCFPVEGKPDKCRLVYIIHTDLKGKFPSKLVDAVLPLLQTNFISSLVKEFNQDSQ